MTTFRETPCHRLQAGMAGVALLLAFGLAPVDIVRPSTGVVTAAVVATSCEIRLDVGTCAGPGQP